MRVTTSVLERRPVGRPRRITLERVVQAACEIGLDRVDMTSVAQKLDIGIATLYGYVTDRNHLVRLVGDHLTRRWSIVDTGQSWEEALREHARLSFDVYRDNPKLIPQLMSGLLGDLADSPHTDTLLHVMIDRGLTPGDALRLYLESNQVLIGAAVGAAYGASMLALAGGKEQLFRRTQSKCAENGYDALSACLASGELFALAGDFEPALERLIDRYREKLGGYPDHSIPPAAKKTNRTSERTGSVSTTLAHAVKATLNFAADPSDGGRHNNKDETDSTLKLTPRELEITDARGLEHAPTIAREGFTIAAHDVGEADWFDEDWVDKVYAPSCNALVKRLTGAKEVVHFFRPLKRIADPAARGDHLVTAGFVHIDHPRTVGDAIARLFVEGQGKDFKRATIYNVWKALTPAPQDRPLAVADRRTIPTQAHVVGVTVSEDAETPYVILAPNEETRYFYFSDMKEDESLVFTGVDLDPENPLGCAHSAFSHPDGGVSRASIEARVIAIFE